MNIIRGHPPIFRFSQRSWLTFPRGKEPPPSSPASQRARRFFSYVDAIIPHPVSAAPSHKGGAAADTDQAYLHPVPWSHRSIPVKPTEIDP